MNARTDAVLREATGCGFRGSPINAVAADAIVSGHADGPVVLANSLRATHQMRDAQVASLEERFRVVRYDTCGHGGFPVPDRPYSIDDLADDLIALLDRFGVGQAHLVGLSLGGMTYGSRPAIRADRPARRTFCTSARAP